MPLFSCTGDSSWAAHIHKITFGFQQRGVTLQDNGISHFDLTGRSKKEPGHPPWPRFDLALGRRLFQPFAVCLGCTGLSIKRKKRNLGSLMMCFQFLPRQYVSICFQYESTVVSFDFTKPCQGWRCPLPSSTVTKSNRPGASLAVQLSGCQHISWYFMMFQLTGA